MCPHFEIGTTFLPAWMLFWALGIVAAQVYFQLSGRHWGLRWYHSLLAGVCLLLTEMLGAKILYLIENWQQVQVQGMTFGGFSLFGVFFAVPVLSLLWARVFSVSYGDFLDYSAGGILLELMFYRVGCFFTGCCGGWPSDSGWLMADGTRRFPVQLLEVGGDLLILLVILWVVYRKANRPGLAFCLMLALYGALRFGLEFLREREILWLCFSGSHFLALAACLVGFVLLLIMRKRRKNEKKLA